MNFAGSRRLGACTIVMLSAAAAHSATIDFDNYTAGSLTQGSTTPLATTDRSFTTPGNQGGWSDSASDSKGWVYNTSSSGLYAGGKAVRASSSITVSGINYIGANKGLNPGSQYHFDCYWPADGTPSGELQVGGWKDHDGDGLFDQSEVGLGAGIVSSGSTRFGFRAASFGSRYISAVAPIFNHWYRVQVELDDATLTATMHVWDLTAGGTLLDLDPNSPATSFSKTFNTLAEYGALSSEFEGVHMRLTSGNAIDNISTGLVPEPAGLGAIAVAGMALMRRRRK